MKNVTEAVRIDDVDSTMHNNTYKTYCVLLNKILLRPGWVLYGGGLGAGLKGKSCASLARAPWCKVLCGGLGVKLLLRCFHSHLLQSPGALALASALGEVPLVQSHTRLFSIFWLVWACRLWQ